MPPGESSCPDGSEYVWQRGVGSLQGRVTAGRSWPLFREKKNHLGQLSVWTTVRQLDFVGLTVWWGTTVRSYSLLRDNCKILQFFQSTDSFFWQLSMAHWQLSHWQLSDLTVVRSDSCPIWQLSDLTVVWSDSCPHWQLSDLTVVRSYRCLILQLISDSCLLTMMIPLEPPPIAWLFAWKADWRHFHMTL